MTLLAVVLAVLAVIAALVSDRGACSRPLNLTAECAGSHVYFCSLVDLRSTLDDPLAVVNSSAPQLSQLLVRSSAIAWLPKEIFVQAPHLRGLLMHECDLNRLHATDFERAQQLQTLLLQSNRLSELPEKVFAAAYALQELHLADNHIHLVHGKAFAALDRLRLLDLRQNSLHELPSGLFADLSSLEYVDLSGNRIERVDSQTFARNAKLRTLLLGDNKFSVFASSALLHLPHLRVLDLSYSEVAELELQAVDTLLVQSSGLRRCTIQRSVVKLRASNNRLEALSVGDKDAVRELELHGNMFASLDDFVGMQNLQKLDVSKNQLTSLHTSHSPLYLPLPSLTNLNLASNQLQNLSAEDFLVLRKLTHLDLAYNHLVRLDQRVFEPLPNLEKLYVEGNRLRRFDYEQLARRHAHLRELGLFNNDWEFGYMRAMIGFLKEGGINLPVRFVFGEAAESLSSGGSKSPEHEVVPLQHHRYAATEMSRAGEVSGIHPYWTTRDILAVSTLVVVMLILLLQFWRILQEENCWAACRSRLRGEAGHVGIAGRNRPRRLAEEDSEV